MRIAISLLLLLVLDTPASACSWFDPCKPAIHHVQKTKPNPVIVAHEKRLGDHDRRISTHDAQFKALVASVVALQRQVAELKAGR